jgi:uncharacterized protein
VATDPVCGMRIDEDEAYAMDLTSDFGDRTYFFCSDVCKEEFDRKPQNYVERRTGRSGSRGRAAGGRGTPVPGVGRPLLLCRPPPLSGRKEGGSMSEPRRVEREHPDAETIEWHDWAPETLERAEAEGKLVFLDISATWCHWCHVLDRTSLSDPRVVRVLRESFIPIRVDTDRRPDVNDRYNQGGWPTTAVLLPNGQLLTGATYLPPDALYSVLAKCAEFYREERDKVDSYIRRASPAALEAAMEPQIPPGAPRSEDLSLVKHAVLAQFDPVHPGFFREPKFLMPETLAFLRDAWVAESNREMGDILLRILRRMGDSGVFDSVEGGFFRYATKRDWTVPHYEKLLSDNADMLALYASACERTQDPAFARAAEGILRFLFARLFDPETGAFAASRDADEEYYALPSPERSRRTPPAVDRTLFSEYNARAVVALLSAHGAFGTGKEIPENAGGSLLERAERLGAFLSRAMWSKEAGQIRYREDGGEQAGFLGDNAASATAHLALWEATGKREYLARAGEVLDWTVRHLFSAKHHGFLDRRPRDGEVATMSVPLVPFAANAQMASALLRFARETSRADLFSVAVRVLQGLSAEYDKRSAFSAPYGSALLLYYKGKSGPACLPGDPACEP